MGHILIKESVGGRRYITPVANNGSIKTGLVAGDFTVVLSAPSGNPPTTTTITPVHIASGNMQDSWIVDIPSGFLTTNGVGDYYLRVVIAATGPKFDGVIGEPVLVTQNLLDDISAGSGLTAQQTRDAMKLAPSGGAPAAGSVDEHLDNIDAYTLISKKMLINRLELADGDSGNWILYDDDDTTPLLTFSVTDKGGLLITQPDGAPSRRTRGV